MSVVDTRMSFRSGNTLALFEVLVDSLPATTYSFDGTSFSISALLSDTSVPVSEWRKFLADLSVFHQELIRRGFAVTPGQPGDYNISSDWKTSNGKFSFDMKVGSQFLTRISWDAPNNPLVFKARGSFVLTPTMFLYWLDVLNTTLRTVAILSGGPL